MKNDVGSVKVDGKVVTGSTPDFVAAGLNVIGGGRLKSGPPHGFSVILK